MSMKARMQRHGANHADGGSDPVPITFPDVVDSIAVTGETPLTGDVTLSSLHDGIQLIQAAQDIGIKLLGLDYAIFEGIVRTTDTPDLSVANQVPFNVAMDWWPIKWFNGPVASSGDGWDTSGGVSNARERVEFGVPGLYLVFTRSWWGNGPTSGAAPTSGYAWLETIRVKYLSAAWTDWTPVDPGFEPLMNDKWANPLPGRRTNGVTIGSTPVTRSDVKVMLWPSYYDGLNPDNAGLRGYHVNEPSQQGSNVIFDCLSIRLRAPETGT